MHILQVTSLFMIFEMKRYRFRDVFVLVEGWMERTICRINEFDVL